MQKIEKPPLKRMWVRCPYCGAKTILYDNTAECSGVYIKCSRGCRKEFEIKIVKGIQVQ